MIAVECRMQSGYLDRMGTDLDEALAIVKEACANMEAVSAASPNREPEAMRDGSDSVADGTKDAARRLRRVLTNDPASGVMRHADAGYEEAIARAREHGLALPMIDGAS